MVYYGLDYVAQIGTLAMSLLMVAFLGVVWVRWLSPVIERMGMVERVKFALYDVELEKYCKEAKVDYSKLDIKFGAAYKKKHGKLQARLNEIEESL